jgi:hypothetical protein
MWRGLMKGNTASPTVTAGKPIWKAVVKPTATSRGRQQCGEHSPAQLCGRVHLPHQDLGIAVRCHHLPFGSNNPCRVAFLEPASAFKLDGSSGREEVDEWGGRSTDVSRTMREA